MAELSELEVGMEVKLDPEGDPYWGWGEAKRGDVGVIKRIYEDKLSIDFPNHPYFTALPEEVKKVDKFVGKRAKIVDCIDGHEFEIGEEIFIKKRDDDGDLVATNGDEEWWIGEEEIEIVEDKITILNNKLSKKFRGNKKM